MWEREPSPGAGADSRRGRAQARGKPSDATAASVPLPARELRLRGRIDQLLHRCHAKERRILALEARERDLMDRVAHWNRRFIDVSEQLREARSVA